MVVDALTCGGAEQHVVDVARALSSRGWQVTVACSVVSRPPAAGLRTAAALERDGVRVVPLARRLVKRRYSGQYAAGIQRLLLRERFDVVHAHIYASAAAAAVAVQATGTPLVVTEHTEAPWRGPRARVVSRRTYAQASAIIAVSTAIRDLLTSHYGVEPAKARIVLPVGDLALPHTRSSPADGVGPPVIGFIGRLCPEKGVDVLLHAFAPVLRRFPAARALIVGDGPQHDDLRSLAASLGIAGPVTFAGHREDIADLLPSFRVLVVPSRSDGTPLVIHEAMLAGVPVIGSNVGGIPDRLRGGDLGTLVPPGDADALAGALCGVLADPAGFRRVAARARRAATSMGFASMVDAIESVYSEVIQRSVEPALPDRRTVR
jgi:glycosyltransferase involved in cell wall biosynthesis